MGHFLARILELTLAKQLCLDVLQKFKSFQFLVLSNNIYTSEEIIFCNDFATPEDANGVIRAYRYNDSVALPPNAQTKIKINRFENGTDFVLALAYPTVDNTGAYDCCTSYYDNNGSYVKDVCYRRNYQVRELITTPLNGRNEIKLSTKRDNYLQIIDRTTDKNPAIQCSFKGGPLPNNVKIASKSVIINFVGNLDLILLCKF